MQKTVGRNPIAKAVKSIRQKIVPNKKREQSELDAAVEKIKYYINEHPDTKGVLQRLKDR